MTEEVEIKKIPFMKKHAGALLIAIIATSIGAIIGAMATDYLEDNTVRELLLANEDSISLINGDLPRQITSNSFLTDKPSKKIKTLFLKKIAIKNNGNTDGENIPLVVCLKGRDLFFIAKPTIKTEPKKIIDAINIQKKPDSTSNKHIWNISLLKPGEYVVFEYMIYSERKVKEIEVNVLARKKGWKVRKGKLLDSNPPKEIKWQDKFVIVCGKFLIWIIIVAIGVLLAVAFAVSVVTIFDKIRKKKKIDTKIDLN